VQAKKKHKTQKSQVVEGTTDTEATAPLPRLLFFLLPLALACVHCMLCFVACCSFFERLFLTHSLFLYT
jgi:hypothetical protein